MNELHLPGLRVHLAIDTGPVLGLSNLCTRYTYFSLSHDICDMLLSVNLFTSDVMFQLCIV